MSDNPGGWIFSSDHQRYYRLTVDENGTFPSYTKLDFLLNITGLDTYEWGPEVGNAQNQRQQATAGYVQHKAVYGSSNQAETT